MTTQPATAIKPSANDRQIGGDHYKGGGVETWDFIVAKRIQYLDGNAIKYLVRYRRKGHLQDLHKAAHYIEKLIEVETALAGESAGKP